MAAPHQGLPTLVKAGWVPHSKSETQGLRGPRRPGSSPTLGVRLPATGARSWAGTLIVSIRKEPSVVPISKTVRVSGSSPRSIEDAITGILGRAAETLEDIRSFKIVDVEGTVDQSGAPAEYTVTLDIRFVVKETAAEHG